MSKTLSESAAEILKASMNAGKEPAQVMAADMQDLGGQTPEQLPTAIGAAASANVKPAPKPGSPGVPAEGMKKGPAAKKIGDEDEALEKDPVDAGAVKAEETEFEGEVVAEEEQLNELKIGGLLTRLKLIPGTLDSVLKARKALKNGDHDEAAGHLNAAADRVAASARMRREKDPKASDNDARVAQELRQRAAQAARRGRMVSSVYMGEDVEQIDEEQPALSRAHREKIKTDLEEIHGPGTVKFRRDEDNFHVVTHTRKDNGETNDHHVNYDKKGNPTVDPEPHLSADHDDNESRYYIPGNLPEQVNEMYGGKVNGKPFKYPHDVDFENDRKLRRGIRDHEDNWDLTDDEVTAIVRSGGVSGMVNGHRVEHADNAFGEEVEQDEKEMKEAYKKKVVKEHLGSMREDVDALFNGESLSEDFRVKATLIFESAVSSRVEKIVEEVLSENEVVLAEAVEEIKTQLSEQVDEYLNYVVEEWVNENQVAIETGLRAELVNDFISGLKNLFAEHYIEIPEEKVDVAEELALEVASMQEAVEKKDAEIAALTEQVNSVKKDKLIRLACEGLTEVQAGKMKSLAESVEFTAEGDFNHKLAVIRENYFPSKVSVTSEVKVLQETAVEEPEVEQVPSYMQHYVKAISKTAPKA